MSRRGKWLAAGLPMVCALAMLCVGCAVGVDDQGAALLAWKTTLRAGDALADWKPSDASPCGWTGVTCDARGGVTELRLESVQLFGGVPDNLTAMGATLALLVLTDTNLTGPIPPELGELPVLANLNLSNNALTGPIPPGLCRPGSKLETLHLNTNNLEGVIPDAIGNLTALREFIFYDNRLAGKIPATIGRMASLEVFRGGGNNNLQGSLPTEIGNCSRLTMIGLAETSIAGSLPVSLGRLKNLTRLAIYTAQLSGPIPPELGQCSSLETIYLYKNALSGSIPTSFGNLSSLKQLDLYDNVLSGSIPAQLGELKNFQSLQLINNNLVGIIPPELGSCTKLRYVDLGLNRLTGHIPASFGNLSWLLELDLYSNNLSGMVPSQLAQCSSLSMLKLDNNQLTGSIPLQLGQCTRLKRLSLFNNELTGPIPRSLFRLPQLTWLEVSNNHLSGELPPEIGSCTTLVRFTASGNHIAGVIPAEIGKLGNLTELDLGSNMLSGMLPAAKISGCRSLTFVDRHDNAIAGELPVGLFQNLLLLQVLDLSHNNISGTLPSDIGMLKSLTKLILNGNRLSGRIPPQIGSCSQLQLLDVGGNLFSGDLQPLSALQNLVALNVSFNGFSGQLPETAFFKKFPRSDFEGNPALCLPQCASDGKRGRTAVAVVLCTLAVLLVATTLALFWWRRRCRDKNSEMSPPWEVTQYQTLEISIAVVARSLTPANVIGHGWSGPVYRVNLPSFSMTIAVKKFQSCDEASIEAFSCEIGVLPLLRHRNIVRLLGWAANQRSRLLFYDYLPNGTLGGLLHGSGAVAEWEMRLMIAIGVAEGLVYLHHDCVPGIIHRDVKAENILLDDRYKPCLADFGLARFADDDGTNHPSPPQFAGSYGYIAPECMANVTTKSDVYSFGVVLLEIITGRRPLDSVFGEGQSVVQWVRDHLCQRRDPTEIVDARLRGQQDTQVKEMLQALQIALLCANPRPHDRPTMKDVLALLRGIPHDEGPLFLSYHLTACMPST